MRERQGASYNRHGSAARAVSRRIPDPSRHNPPAWRWAPVQQTARPFSDYEQALQWLAGRVAAHAQAREIADVPAESPQSIDERLIQCVWHDGLLVGRALQTVAGKPLTVQNPGDWNHEAGPDFRRAELILDGRVLKGDVEIHLRSSDWTAHGHDRNFDYNSVVLHVFLQQTDSCRHDVLHNGRTVERLCLAPQLEMDLETLRQSLAVDDYGVGEPQRRGRCHETVLSLDADTLAAILDLAGERRLEEKAARFEAQLAGESLDQVFYQAFLASLGHKSGKALYFLLAKRTPTAELRDHAAECPAPDRARLLEAILFHVANLVPTAADRAPLDETTQAYLDTLNRHWSRVAGYFSDRIIPATRRWYQGIRPVNFPCRRLAGVAQLLAQWMDRGPVAAVLDLLWRAAPAQPDRRSVKRMAEQLGAVLSVETDHYFTRRYVWGGKPAAHALSLIGEGQAKSLLFNAVLPIALLQARRAGDAARAGRVRALWRQFPVLAENQIVRLMRERLFGNDPRFAGLFTTEHRLQALHQIFNDCCNNRATDCSQCSLFGAKAA
ncbi:MAG: DUF2851 family protein [Candidatus Sumerlaeia bacterium]|nr:DUF2851 family protein [Candidatus Sumerlaeia bacterium]